MKLKYLRRALAGSASLFALYGFPALAQNDVDWSLLDQYCSDCHNLDDQAGGVAFDLLTRDALAPDAETWELAVRKMRTGMMPPAGKPRPERAVFDAFV